MDIGYVICLFEEEEEEEKWSEIKLRKIKITWGIEDVLTSQ